MSIQLHGTTKRNRLSLTPLIDVVFLLLLFFMLATQFDKYQSIDLVFPSSNSEQPQEESKPIIIHLVKGEKTIVNGNEVKQGILLDQVFRSVPKKSTGVVLKIGEKVPTERLTKTIENLKLQGISPITLSQ